MKNIEFFFDEICQNNLISEYYIKSSTDKKRIINLIKKIKINLPVSIINLYMSYNSLSFFWTIDHSDIDKLTPIDADTDIIFGKCNIIDFELFVNYFYSEKITTECVRLNASSNIYIFEYIENEYFAGLFEKDGYIEDNVHYYNITNQTYYDLNVTVKKYIELLLESRGFIEWQLAYINKKSHQNTLLNHYLKVLFKLEDYNLRSFN
jgi:hypothetical protein